MYISLLFWITDVVQMKKIKISGIVDANKSDTSMSLNDNYQESGETNDNVVQNDQYGTSPAQIHILLVNQDNHSKLTSTGHSKSSTSKTSDKKS